MDTTETFDFTINYKETIWSSTRFSVEANSLEEAKQKLIEMAKTEGIDSIHTLAIDDPYYEHEYLYETGTFMTPEENGGYPTIEIMSYSDSDVIITNVEGTK